MKWLLGGVAVLLVFVLLSASATVSLYLKPIHAPGSLEFPLTGGGRAVQVGAVRPSLGCLRELKPS